MDQERDIEAYLRRRVEMLGGMAMKFVSPGNDGVPDRIVIMPGGLVTFVELKAPGGRLRAIQKWQHERIRKRGCEVRVIWSSCLMSTSKEPSIRSNARSRWGSY